VGDTRPNVVLVVADDLAVGDLGIYGARLIDTPVIDRLAASGVVCAEMYAAAATDTPARAGLLVGRYGARYGLPATMTPTTAAGLPADATTVAELLRGAGYATALFGQWRLGAQAGQHPLDHGFDRFAGTLYGTDVSPLAWYEDRTAVDTDFDYALADRRIVDAALGFIDELRGDDWRDRDQRADGRRRRPFLAVLSHLAPHAPFRAEPHFFRRSDAGLYGDVVQQFDHYLGELLERLHRWRMDERTLVIVTSDNGPRYEGRTQNRRGRKPEVFDGGVRVPFVASWLTSRRRVRDRVPRSLLDVTPTVCALAGVTPPGGLDGEDMSRLLRGKGAPARGPVYLFFNQRLNAMRSGRWKFHVGFGNGGFGSQYMPQLYDVEADFRENCSVANLHPDVVARLRAGLEAVRDDVLAEAGSQSAGVAA
jgi:arylsulfatase A